MKILGMEIDNKTNLIALAAFLLSLGTIITNIANMIKGPKVKIIKPEQVSIFPYKSHANNKEYLKIYSDICFFNDAAPGYDDVVSRVTATMIVGSKNINLQWQYFAISDIDKNKNIIEREKKPIRPTLIKAKRCGGGETHFYPFIEKNKDKGNNFLLWEDFKKILKTEKIDTIIVIFRYETLSRKRDRVRCKIKVDDNFLFYINKNNRVNTYFL